MMRRDRVGRHAALGIACVLLLAGASGAAARDDVEEIAGDAGVRATLVREGRPFAVGVVGALVVAVRTPPGHRVTVPDGPALSNAEIVRRHTDVREHPGGGWLHRTHFRVRPLAANPLTWPALSVVVEAPDGARSALALPERVFEVDAVMRGVEDDRPPYGYRGLEQTGTTRGQGFVSGLVGGASITLAAIGGLVWLRRRRERTGAATARPRAVDSALPPGRASADHLADARAALPDDPREASSLAAAALRAAASRHFRVDLTAATTEELRAARPSSAPSDVFDALVRVLQRHDSARFQKRPVTREEVADNLEQSARWIDGQSGGGAPRS